MESFIRYEDKFFIKESEKNSFLKNIKDFISPDAFPEYDIHNIYYDSDDYRMIRESINTHSGFKQKLRSRTYGNIQEGIPIFLEIKKKYKGLGEKRRIEVNDSVLLHPVDSGFEPVSSEKQVFNEIKHVFSSNHAVPKVFISYHREAYSSHDSDPIRITFDSDIKYRIKDISINSSDIDRQLDINNLVLMEIKQRRPYPVWLRNALKDINARETSFSKYGEIYKRNILKEVLNYA